MVSPTWRTNQYSKHDASLCEIFFGIFVFFIDVFWSVVQEEEELAHL